MEETRGQQPELDGHTDSILDHLRTQRETSRRQTPKSLYQHLYSHVLKSPLGDLDFLPLNNLHEGITRDSVRAQLFPESLLLQPNLPKKVVQHAKKIFAILVFIGEPCAIVDLLQEGLTDEHLPLSASPDQHDIAPVSVHGKTFMSFFGWENEPRVAEFLEKQWLVQAPVLDTTGKHIVLDPKCALPFLDVARISVGEFIRVSKGKIHPAHQQGFEVSIILAPGMLIDTNVRRRTAM
jgi:hypothetical protein